ncbi:MAG: hypothetical protein U0795_00970 [Pirellulales bacterium]
MLIIQAGTLSQCGNLDCRSLPADCESSSCWSLAELVELVELFALERTVLRGFTVSVEDGLRRLMSIAMGSVTCVGPNAAGAEGAAGAGGAARGAAGGGTVRAWPAGDARVAGGGAVMAGGSIGLLARGGMTGGAGGTLGAGGADPVGGRTPDTVEFTSCLLFRPLVRRARRALSWAKTAYERHCRALFW